MNKEWITDMLNFIESSPTAFQTVSQIKAILTKEGYVELAESEIWQMEPAGLYFTTRNHSSILAWQMPQDYTRLSYNIVASHSDSPTFKIKPNAVIQENGYLKLNTEGYGGMLCATWMDRPLSLAGRVIVREEDRIVSRYLDCKRPLLTIPSLAIHMNREANSNASYNPQKDMLPIMGLGKEPFDLKVFLARELGVSPEAVLSFDLYLKNLEKGYVWGINEDLVSSCRLDDLQCAYTTLQGFLQGSSAHSVNVYCCFDNEEVGSRTRQGAASTFLLDTLRRIHCSMGLPESDLIRALASSLMVSADNAHAVHPNVPEKSDPTNRVYLNQGLVIKYNANQSYTSDAVSAALFQQLCQEAKVPVQIFTNRSDLKGGGTLGSISTSQVSIASVDIGLPQLAMHSANETAGVLDCDYMVRAIRRFYSTHRELMADGVLVQKEDLPKPDEKMAGKENGCDHHSAD